MKRNFGILAILAFAMVVSGCIETSTLVRVNRDGSGTVKETIKMNKMVVGMMKGMASSMQDAFQAEGAEGEENATAGSDTPPKDEALFSEEKARAQAEKMGAGVELLSYEEIEDNASTGYTAVYTFDNINELRVNQNPGASMPSMPGESESEGEGEGDEEYVLFAFTPGSPATLEITPPQDDEEETQEETMEEEMDMEGDEESADEGMGGFEQMKEFFRGMRLKIALEFAGGIEETNATYVDGNTVTLIEMDFDTLLENPDALEKLEQSEKMSPAEAKEILHDIPGIKFDTADRIVVTFN